MAENCYNTILFQGDRVAECLEFIKSRMTENRYDGIYLMDGKQEKSCFDLTIEDGVVDFITEGSPDIYQVDQLALKFGLDYRYDYVQIESKLFGCVIADGGGMSVVYLEAKDFDEFDKIERDEENNTFWFRNEEYESELEILDILLEEKIKLN
tara:strand:+ start:601 stop:1059 length:459 start_codon:yes stop_codon:yes gene_type:complete